MLSFLDRHLALTGVALLLLDALFIVAAVALTPRDHPLTPVFGSHDAALVFILVWLLIAVLGATLFLLGVTRSRHAPPFTKPRNPPT